MILIYTQKVTPRIDYTFKHICTRILGLETAFTSSIEEFIAHVGPKLSYGKVPLGNELFIRSQGLLSEQGFDNVPITIKEWDESIGFFPTGDRSILPFDIFAASFYLLSRYEEYLPHVKDEMGRFPASESLAFKHGFLQQPVVDIWAYKLKERIVQRFPDFVFHKKKFVVHNLVEAKQPYAYVQKGFFGTFIGYGRDLAKFRIRKIIGRTQSLLKIKNDPYDTFNWMLNAAKYSLYPLTIFFLMGQAFKFEEHINSRRSKFQLLLKHVMDYKEVGLIFSYHSLKDEIKLKEEKKRMEEIIHKTVQSSMNAQYQVNLPDLYRSLLELEIETDYTMFYQEEPGFRASTCTPFLFFDLDYEVKSPLTIHPIAGASKNYQFEKREKAYDSVLRMMKQTEAVNGTFSFLFSNRDFIKSKKNRHWRELFLETLQKHDS